jgi:hypothetical protein
MKGVVLLAVIHILIIYQSRKNKPAPKKDIPAQTVLVPKAVKNPVSQPNSVVGKPGYAVFMLPKNTSFPGRVIHN